MARMTLTMMVVRTVRFWRGLELEREKAASGVGADEGDEVEDEAEEEGDGVVEDGMLARLTRGEGDGAWVGVVVGGTGIGRVLYGAGAIFSSFGR